MALDRLVLTLAALVVLFLLALAVAPFAASLFSML
jgi:hypothetical protein